MKIADGSIEHECLWMGGTLAIQDSIDGRAIGLVTLSPAAWGILRTVMDEVMGSEVSNV